MEDDTLDRGPANDGPRINIDEEYEVLFWTHALQVTRLQLAWAVRTAGPSVRAVRRYLAGGQHVEN
jgi:hypothetical protein